MALSITQNAHRWCQDTLVRSHDRYSFSKSREERGHTKDNKSIEQDDVRLEQLLFTGIDDREDGTTVEVPHNPRSLSIGPHSRQKLNDLRIRRLQDPKNQSLCLSSNMDIPEINIDARLPYRIGNCTLPALPVEHIYPPTPVHITIPDKNQVNIRKILQQHNVDIDHTRTEPRPFPGRNASNTSLTLVFVCRYKPGCEDEWINAVKEVHESLAQDGLYWPIEMIDYRAYGRLRIGAIVGENDEAIIEGWEKIRPDFLKIIEDRDLVSIDLMRREYPEREELQPSLIICARDANDAIWWDSILPKLRELVHANNFNVDVVLLYLEGLTWATDYEAFAVDDEPSITNSESSMTDDGYSATYSPTGKSSYYRPIWMGSSCGLRGSGLSGTLGGGITLQDGSHTVEVALSCYHVFKEAFSETQIGPFGSDSGHIRADVVSPSDYDHKKMKQGTGDEIEGNEYYHDKYSRQLEMMIDADPNWGDVMAEIELCETAKRVLEMNLGIAERCNRHFAQVHSASGFRTAKYPQQDDENWALDWCLLAMNDSRSISREVPPISKKVTKFIKTGEMLTKYCNISKLGRKKTYDVIKRGKATGWTAGLINSIASIYFEKAYGGRQVQFYSVVSKSQGRFSDLGDSGSLILLYDNSDIPDPIIVGLLAGENCAIGATLIIPIGMVLKDIEYVTGAKVVQPEFAGEI